MDDDAARHMLYRLRNARGALLYVGRTLRMRNRIKHHAEHKDWWTDVVRIDLEHFDSDTALRRAEARAIATERPRYNIKAGTPAGEAMAVCSSTVYRPGEVADLERFAKARGETDGYGTGGGVVIRRALRNYVKKHRHLLPEELRD